MVCIFVEWMDGERHDFTHAEAIEGMKNDNTIMFKTQLGDIYLIPIVNLRRVVFSEDEDEEE